MDKYDVKNYQEVDRDFVKQVSEMEDGDTLLIQIQDMEGKPLLEADGTIVEVPLEKEDCDGFLRIMREDNLSFNEVVVEIINKGMNEEFPEGL